MTLIPLQQLKGLSQNNSKVFLLSLSVIMLYSTGHTIEFVNQTPFGKKPVLNTYNQFQLRFKTCFTTKKHNAEMTCQLFSHNRSVQNVSFIKLKCFSVVLSSLFMITHKQMFVLKD